jgi:hypothetical protein
MEGVRMCVELAWQLVDPSSSSSSSSFTPWLIAVNIYQRFGVPFDQQTAVN